MQTPAPPPAYSAFPPACAPRSLFESLPSHLLLRILSDLSLSDLIFALRPASRTLFLHATSLAREQAYGIWVEEVQRMASSRRGAPPPSTDPLGRAEECAGHAEDVETAPPSYNPDPGQSGTDTLLSSRTRELAVFDLFIVALARSSYKLSASTLLFTNEDDALRIPSDVRQDLFGMMQPRARVEDLLIQLGRRRGWIVQASAGAQSDKTSEAARLSGIVADDLRVDLKLREVRMLLPCRGSGRGLVWRPVFGTNRSEGDTLETLARCLALGMQGVRVTRHEDATKLRWYQWQ
ncbi:hypothetical protein NBRC10512_007662 [Rhodotorula toruloides]|uniref:RHTO0S05e00760g1_1 n=2 Tax=Rhodotorula toruloides TaxID=5286 RepID=A0A061AZW1_RHOTO|nr:uncharacterized protein RHTO_02362 [Rhodotorula toruloides NP11]EMS20748.1 hypothetical protein RHTO_02362 [Rhodotorula toruloides NP11]CDR40289.1 RHTO0S05e00760g1_1 [Rhodotorula toruloides]